MNETTNTPHRLITAEYQLYDVDGEKQTLLQQTTERPFEFVTGMGLVLPAFEEALATLEAGDEFDFTLEPNKAYGDYVKERVVDVPKEAFIENGKFDDEHIQQGAIVPLQNERGDRFNGRVVTITDTAVTFDLNHPLAGKTLRFHGCVRTANNLSPEMAAEYERMINGGCGGHCEECRKDCASRE